MTSKEALNQLYILADMPEQAMVIQSYYDIVEKDLETLEKYKELEEQGRLIKLPCAVGDKIYIVNFPYLAEDEIKKISINYETRTELIKEYQIGTYAFFDKEAAETLFEHIKEMINEK